MKFVLLLAVTAAIIACTCAAEYQWGEPGPKDYLIAKDKVTKRWIFGLVRTKKYVFKQKRVDALTITAIKVTDRKKKYDSTAELISGGLGSKGCTIKLKSKRGKSIKSRVEIWGR